jgi:hypothetical protein
MVYYSCALLWQVLYLGDVTASGRRHGSGVVELVDGVTFRGRWRADEPSGAGVEEYPDGTTLKGACTIVAHSIPGSQSHRQDPIENSILQSAYR